MYLHPRRGAALTLQVGMSRVGWAPVGGKPLSTRPPCGCRIPVRTRFQVESSTWQLLVHVQNRKFTDFVIQEKASNTKRVLEKGTHRSHCLSFLALCLLLRTPLTSSFASYLTLKVTKLALSQSSDVAAGALINYITGCLKRKAV